MYKNEKSLGLRMLAAVNNGFSNLLDRKDEITNKIEDYLMENYHLTSEDVEVSHFNNTTSVIIPTASGFDGQDFVIEEKNFSQDGVDYVISANDGILVLSLVIDDVRIPVSEKSLF